MSADQRRYAAQLAKWREHPSVMVRELFGVTPDPWQDQVLEAFPHKQRIALPASKGPGKTCTLAWLGWNFMLTRPTPKCAATSISGDNLRDNLWTEMAKWQQRAPLLRSLFTWTKERIFANENPEQWWMSARTYTQSGDQTQQANTLAGLHADYILFLVDESGGMSDAVMVSADAALSSCKEGHIIQAGNPTQLSGPLYRAVQNENGLWHVIRITSDPDDPNRSPRVSVEWARQFISEWGVDSDWTRVNVFGLFPRASFNALISPDDVRAAMRRSYTAFQIGPAPRVMGVDVARYGDDCFDDITKILTDEGWKLFSDLSGSERVLSIENDKASWESIDAIHQYDFDGEMNLMESKSLNFCATDKHRFLVKRNPKSGAYKFGAYRDLPQEFVIREQNGWAGASPASITFTAKDAMPHGGLRARTWTFNYIEWATLLGWFVSEGNVYRETRKGGRLRILIAQNPGHKQELIKALLTKMGFSWRIAAKGKQLEISNNQIGRYLLGQCGHGAANKRVPSEIRNGSEEVIRAFLDAFLLGDGTCRANGRGRTYVTSSKLLADDIQEMLFKLGHAGAMRLKERKGSLFHIDGRDVVRSHDTFLVYERSSQFGKTVRKKDVVRVKYTGKIWCVSTRFQSICVRRKGIPMWSGNSSVIAKREGIQAYTFIAHRNLDSVRGAAIVNREWINWEADAAFIDDTGGFGSGWIDQLGLLGKAPIGVHFASSAHEKLKFENKRAEMYFEMAQWIKNGGALPDDKDLLQDLTNTTYSAPKGVLCLEPKAMVKAKQLGRSPDGADALALTFAEPVSPMAKQHIRKQIAQTYLPFAELDRRDEPTYARQGYDPFGGG